MEKVKLRQKITLGLILIFLGILLLFNNSILDKREEVFSSMNMELSEIFLNEDEDVDDLEVSDTNNEENTSEDTGLSDAEPDISEVKPVVDNNTNYESYVGILDIPKIGFNKGFYKKESSLNNVKFNIKILVDSSYPDQDKGNVIIIGHSGNYNNSYFANLYKLELGDMASISYMNSKYNYKIVDIYTDTKDGTVTIYRNENKSCLTLITCTKDDDTTQTIYIFELENIE